ncbi:DUF3667 domain-containing protein [candidate division CSSED10-310 bacterium]|uniref:DUF3667 domain-containing protein n=1 Tax=candidate division CSSED10-310 bacterium TaxID=2855610 RepID=A0ABV6Z3D9_UNCC1
MDSDQIEAGSENQDKQNHGASCQNCGRQLVGEFCHHCGQQHIAERLSIKLLVKWVTKPVLNLDRGLGLTVYELFVDPGGMARRYIAGQRKKYTNPFVYLFLWTAIALMANSLFFSDVRADVRNSLKEAYQNLQIFSAVQLEAYVDAAIRLDTYSAQVLILLSIPLAFFLKLTFRKKTSYNLAEIFVFNIFIIGQVKLIDIFLILVISFFQLSFNSYLYSTFTLMTVGFIYGGIGFFGRSFWGVLRIVTALIVGYLLYSLVMLTILITFVLLFY